MLFSFIETHLFARLRDKYLAEDDYALLQMALMESPERGPVIPGSRRRAQAALESAWAWQARRRARHLLREGSRRRDLDVDALREERGAKHSRAPAAQDQRGI